MSDDNAQNGNDPQANPKKLFVGNLPFSMGEQDIQELFAEHGEVTDVHLVLDRETHRSRGFAFVEYAEDDSANKAIDALNGHEVDGRAIVVNVAKPPRPRPSGGRSFGRGDFNRRDDRRNDRRDY